MHDFIGIADSVKHGILHSYIVNVPDMNIGLTEVMKFAKSMPKENTENR